MSYSTYLEKSVFETKKNGTYLLILVTKCVYFCIFLELRSKEKLWEQKYIDQQRLYEQSERQVIKIFKLLSK